MWQRTTSNHQPRRHEYRGGKVCGCIMRDRDPPRHHISVEKNFTWRRCTVVVGSCFYHHISVLTRFSLFFCSVYFDKYIDEICVSCLKRVLRDKMSKPLKVEEWSEDYWHKHPNSQVHCGMFACDDCQWIHYWDQVRITPSEPDFLFPLHSPENVLFDGVHGIFGDFWRAGCA